ncbi:MAG: hypothetical protein JSU09_16445 [Bacteroidetes bacterium]|nr:hypothetical protein [Bacteroidota bacterium]
MNQDEYKYKVEVELGKSIRDHVSTLKSIVVRNYPMTIAKVDRVDVRADLDNVKLHHLLSGNEVEINVGGTVSMFEAKDGGTSLKYVTFWVRPAKVKFNLANENFDVLDISNFLPLDN